jgi:hypothetical protein
VAALVCVDGCAVFASPAVQGGRVLMIASASCWGRSADMKCSAIGMWFGTWLKGGLVNLAS